MGRQRAECTIRVPYIARFRPRRMIRRERIARMETRTATARRTRTSRALHQSAHKCDEIVQLADYTPVSFAARSYSYLRRFVPRFLNIMQFQAEENDNPLLDAITFMKAVDSRQRAFDQPPLQFIPWRWRSYVEDEKKVVNRQRT